MRKSLLKIKAFFICVMLSSGAQALDSSGERATLIESLREAAATSAAATGAVNAPKVPDETIDALTRCFIGNCSHVVPPSWGGIFVQNREADRIRDLVEVMKAQGKFLILNEEIRKQFNLESLLCKIPDHCTSVAAFYLPLTHQIFLDTSLPRAEQVEALVHELRHAYQFTYRFPLDLSELFAKVQEKKIRPDELSEYLDFYYESQASWKGFLAYQDPAWVPYYTKFGEIKSEAAKNGHGAPGEGFFGGITGHFHAQKFLPKLESSHFWSFNSYGYEGNSQYEGMPALALPELVCAQGIAPNVGVDNYDFPFHALYCSAIVKYYFGSLPFVFQKNRDDLAIYNDLHDNYYRRLGGNDRVGPSRDNIRNHFSHLSRSCVRLIDKIKNSQTAPLVEWLSLSQADLGTCSVYANTLDENGADEFIKTLLQNFDSQSPFNILMPGGEGSHPELVVRPSLQILPQLKIKPDVLK